MATMAILRGRSLAWPALVAGLAVGCAAGASLTGAGSTSGASSSSGSSSGGASSTASSSGSSTSGTGGAGNGGHGGHGGSPILPGPGGSTSVSVSVSSSSSGTGGSTICPTGNCALRYDGVSNYVSVPTSSTLDFTSSPLTVEAWVYFDQLANCMAIVRKGTSATAYNYWLRKNISPADSVFWSSSSAFAVTVFTAVTPAVWHHLASVYDPATISAIVYVDGQSKGSSTTNGVLTTNGEELRIGIDWDMGCAMKGVIDEVRISNVARYMGTFSPQKVFANDVSTTALWHFDEYGGSIAHDASGHGNDGTIHGATWTTEHP
jgi:hypothetical protein